MFRFHATFRIRLCFQRFVGPSQKSNTCKFLRKLYVNKREKSIKVSQTSLKPIKKDILFTEISTLFIENNYLNNYLNNTHKN